MKFSKLATLPFVAALFLGTTLGGLTQSHAGFQVAAPNAAEPAQNQKAPEANVEMDGTVLPAPQTEKTFEVYNDRYVPDSVRKKYNLDENWFGKTQAPVEASQPTPITPNILEVAPIKAAMPEVKAPVEAPVAPPVEVSAEAPVEAKVTEAIPKREPVESWRGRKGENIRDVLQRWSVRGGTDLMWASPDTPVLQKEFTFIGKFQDAVNALIKAEGGDKIHSQYRSEGMNPVMMAPASTITTNTAPALPDEVAQPEVKKPEPVVNPLAKIFVPEKKVDAKPETRWFALSGAPLAEVIQVWADDAGVKLVWQSEKSFAVKESISQVGHFEDAVFRAFSQYDSEKIRPVGEIYQDPLSGQKTLLVRTEVN